jgi:hypothetical protein
MKLRDEFELHTGIPVSHTADDAEENEKGSVNLGSSDLELVEDSGNQLVGLRFNDIKLEGNAKIKNAYIQFTCDTPTKEATSLIIAAENSANATRFNDDDHDLSSRSLTGKEVGWSPPEWKKAGTSGKEQRTPDLSALIESVIRRPDWRPGNSLAFLFSGSGKRVASAWRDGGKRAAKLVVDAEQTVTAPKTGTPPEKYRVRMYFGVPKLADRGDVVFDIYLQGERVLEQFTLKPSGPNGAKFAVETMKNVQIGDELQVKFVAKQGKPVLSGIELVRQSSSKSE